MSNLKTCPRCGSHALEVLLTHSHCLECNYSPDTDGNLKHHTSPRFNQKNDKKKSNENILNKKTEKQNEE